MEIIPTSAPTRLLNDVYAQQAAIWDNPFMLVPNLALNVADTTVNSLTFGMFENSSGSLFPTSWSSYHNQRPLTEVVSGVGSLFAGVGLGTRAVQFGGILSRGLGRYSPAAASAIFANADRVRQYDTIMATSRNALATGFARQGFVTPNLYLRSGPMGAGSEALQALTGANRYEDAALWASRARTRQGLVEGLGQEAAIFALANQNEFLFPPDQGMFPMLAFAGVGVGLNIGFEHILGRAAMRTSVQNAGRLAAATAADFRAGGRFTEGLAAQGDQLAHWQSGMAQLYTMERAGALEAAADAIVQAGGGGLTRAEVMRQLGEARLSAQTGLTGTLRNINASRAPEEVLRSGFGSRAAVSTDWRADATAISELQRRIEANPHAIVNLRHLENATPIEASRGSRQVNSVLYRYDELAAHIDESLDRTRQALTTATDPKDVARLANEERRLMQANNEIQRVRPAVIETTGAVNYNVARMRPYAELPQARQALKQDPVTRAWEHGGELAIRSDGTINVRQGQALVHASDLNPLQMTEAYTIVGKLARNERATSEMWASFMSNPNLTWRDLPPQILDAIANQTLKLNPMSTHPAVARIRADIAGGVPALVSLMKKLDWVKAHKADGHDLMDLEKILNLRLTDDFGQPNGMGLLLQAWREVPSDVDALSAFGHAAHLNAGTDSLTDYVVNSLSNFAAAYHGVPVADIRHITEDGISQGLRGIDAFSMHEGVGGIGAIYNHTPLPTRTEMDRARLAALRNASAKNALVNSPSEITRTAATAVLENPQLAEIAGRVSELAADPVRKRNSVIAQRTFQERGFGPVEAAAAIRSHVTRMTNPVVEAILKPIVDAKVALFKHPQWSVIMAGMSNAKHLTQRGVALRSREYVAGLNPIDISRPGAQHLLDTLGPLRGAPTDADDWHMFDIAIAANEGRYVPVQLHPVGADMLNLIRQADQELLAGINSNRAAAGHPQLEEFFGHLPEQNFNRYKLRYIADAEGRVRHYVRGKTDQEADRLLTEALARLEAKHGSGRFLHMPEAQIAEYFDVHDQVFLNGLRDMSGIKQTGTSGGRNVDFALDISGDFLDDMVISLRNTAEDVVQRTIAGMFSNSLAEAKMILARADAKTPGVFNTVQNWGEILLGRSRLAEESGAKQGHDLITRYANAAIGAIGDNMPGFLTQALHWLNNPAGLAASNRKAIEDLIANHQPFNHLMADADLSAYLKIDRSVDSYRLASALQAANKGTTYAFLQHFNIAHPILNITGAMVTSPAVLRQFMPMAGESADDFARRVGPVAEILDKDRMVATPSPHRLMIEGFENVWNNSSAMQYAVNHGYITPNLFEEINALNNLRPSRFTEALEAVAKWTDFLNMGINKGMRAAGREPSAETISERSETFTRAWLHMIGYVTASRGSRAGATEAQKHMFAHQFANQNIADFSPNLRGDAFRGVAGIPFGLFQSYAVNMYQRLFRYIEDGNKRALAIQMATQASMFGLSGLPGWNQLNSLYFDGPDTRPDRYGATSLNERLYTRLGKQASDILMTGGISSLPRIINLLPGEQGATNLSLYTSGDMNLRQIGWPPSVGALTMTLTGAHELLVRAGEEMGHAWREGERASPGRIAEVLAHYAPSRGFRSMVDLVLGERRDRNGNLLVEDTRSGVALVSRLLGTRTHNELLIQQAAWQNSQGQAQRIAELGRLRHHMLRRVRSGDMDTEEAAAYLARYLARGGNEESWDRWLNYTAEAALNTRDRRLMSEITGTAGELLGYEFAPAARLVAATGSQAAEPLQQALPTM